MINSEATAIRELLKERSYLRPALEIIAEHSTDDGSRALASAALAFEPRQATGRAEAS